MRLFLLLLTLLAFHSPHALSQGIVLNHAQLLLSDSTTPPTGDDRWHKVTLPDRWEAERYGESERREGWYRFELDHISAPAELWGIYLPRLNMNASVWFNGQQLGSGGSFNEPLGRNWARPLYFTIPPALWREQGNTVAIHLASYYGYGLLEPLQIGPDAVLKPRYQQARFWRIDIANSLFLILAVITLIIFIVWRRRPDDKIYLWFALTTLLWSFLALNTFIKEIPISEKLWDTFIYSTIAWWSVFLAIFAHRFAHTPHRRLEQGYILWAGIVSLGYIVSDIPSLPTAEFYGQIGSPIIGFITLGRVINAWRRNRERHVAALAGGIGLIQLAGIYNFLGQSHLIPAELYIGQLVEISSPVLLILIAWHLVHQFVTALNESETLNVELEARVAAKYVELEENYKKLGDLEQQQAITRERERIHRDLHDDVGAKLLTLAEHSDDPQQAEIARSALHDLNDVATHVSLDKLTLTEALANWRSECNSRLDAAAIQLNWQQAELPPTTLLPQQTMNIGRILREAVSNTIRHADASEVSIAISQQGEEIQITINNDGHPLDTGALQSSRGTQNMQIRAQQLGGDIHWQTGTTGGCTIEWHFPIALPNNI